MMSFANRYVRTIIIDDNESVATFMVGVCWRDKKRFGDSNRAFLFLFDRHYLNNR